MIDPCAYRINVPTGDFQGGTPIQL
jgi:hypothetical protein